MEQRETDAEAQWPPRPPGPGLAASPPALAIAITLCPSCGAPFYTQGGLRDYDPYSHIIPQVTEYDKAGC